MKISKTALAAALVAGLGGIAATSPAIAKDKQDEKNATAQLKLSDEVRKAAVAAQTALAANDFATAETNIAAAEAAAKNDDEKYVAESLRLTLIANRNAGDTANTAAGNSQHDQELIAPLEALIANPSTPPSELGRFNFLRGEVSFNAGKYQDALQYLKKAQAAGFQNPNLPLQMVKAQVESGDVQGGIAQLGTLIEQQKASGQTPPEAWYRYGIAKLYKTTDRATTLDWVQRWLSAYPSTKNWRDAIIVFGFQGPSASRLDNPQKVDLYRLLSQTGGLADRGDYIDYAQLASRVGLPVEAKSVIDKGRASGAIPASDGDATALYADAEKSIRGDEPLTKLAAKAKTGSNGELAAQTADAYLGGGDYANAIELYRLALQKGGVNNDEVNTHLGIALAESGDKAGAATAFKAVTSQPRADIASLWGTWIANSGGGAPVAPAAPAAAAAAPATGS